MKRQLQSSWLTFVFVVIAFLLVAASCEDDDRELEAPSGTGEGTPSADFVEPTTVDEDDDEGVAGDEVEPEVTVPPADEGEGTFPDVRSSVPPLENFTLTIDGTFDYTTPEDEGQSNIELLYQQSEPGVFYLVADGADEYEYEAWVINDEMWIRDEGEEDEGVSLTPPELAEDFDIAAYLGLLPELDGIDISEIEEVGQEDVEGLSTTHYTISGPDAVQLLPGMRASDVSDVEGNIDIWFAEEEDAVLRVMVDLSWTDAEGSDNTAELEYVLTEIGETEDVQVPEV